MGECKQQKKTKWRSRYWRPRREVRTETWMHGAISAASKHWPEYLIEGACLGLFMISTCSFTVLLQHPGSAIRQLLPSPSVRRLLTGVAMGLIAIALIHSPWGRRSGAHLNPSVTLTFFRLGKMELWDVCFYAGGSGISGLAGPLAHGSSSRT
jgi:aquaporin Z